MWMVGQTPELSGVCLYLLQVGEFGELIPERDGENANEGEERRNKKEIHGKAPGMKPGGPVWNGCLYCLPKADARNMPIVQEFAHYGAD